MQQTRQEQPIANKNYATYIAGLFTEATPLNFPDNTVQYTQNFRYDPAGYIERRLGLELHNCGFDSVGNDKCNVAQAYRWRNVANRKNLDFIVFQNGSKLYLYEEIEYDCYEEKCVYDLTQYAVAGDSTLISKDYISMAHGNGSLFITGKFIQPMRIDYTPDKTTTICTDDDSELGCKYAPFDICERDFEGVEDDIPLDKHPTELTDSHLYNLLNRGWTLEHIYAYFDEFGEYPSKNEYHQLGWKTGDDGNEVWDAKEVRTGSTGSSSAPQGHVIRSIFNTCKQDCKDPFAEPGQGEENPERDIEVIVTDDWYLPHNTAQIKFPTPHNLSPGDPVILSDGNQIINHWCTTSHIGTDITIETGVQTINLDGVYTTYTIIDPRTIEITFTPTMPASDYTGDCAGSRDRTVTSGKAKAGSIMPENLPCCKETYRPRTNAFYAGRIWHMSMDSDRIGTNVYFSQVIRNHADEGQAYQDQDPTARDYNELLKDDGGVISIPEMGRVLEARVMKDSLLLFADNGIWSISGGNNYFDATYYTVSKLTDVGCISKKSIVEVEDTIIYASARGVYAVSPNTRTQSITERNVHTQYYNIPLHNKEHIRIVYHKFDKTLHILYACDECRYRYNEELILNTRSTAWYIYKYTSQIISDVFLTKNHHVRGRGLNYLVQEGDKTSSYYMTDCKYKDFMVQEPADAYLHTAPETLGDLMFEKRILKQKYFFDNIVDSQAIVSHVWDWRNIEGECKEDGTLITLDSPCKVLHTDYTDNDVSLSDSIHGVALSVEMSSVEDRPLKIYGWSTQYEGMPDYEPGRSRKITRRDRRYK